MKATICIFILILTVLRLQAEDGHNLWFRNKSTGTVNVVCSRSSATLTIAREELQKGWSGKAGASIVLTIKHDKAITGDGFRLSLNGVQANTELGILYGAYEFLRRQQTGQPIGEEICNPSYEFRVLNHWDNLPADTYCYFRCRKYRAGCQLVRLSLCTGKLVCFWPSGMEQPVEK